MAEMLASDLHSNTAPAALCLTEALRQLPSGESAGPALCRERYLPSQLRRLWLH